MKTIAAVILIASPRSHPHVSGRRQRRSPAVAPALTQTQRDQHARQLLDQMVAALGGDLWLNRHDMETQGHTAAFFHGQPTGAVVDFWDFRQFPGDLERIEYTKKRDDVLLFNATAGYEITYKGKIALPKDQLDDVLRRRHHSIEEVVRTWLKAPGVMIVGEGTSMVERRIADKVTILAADNDAVTLELDATTHLPLRRTFETRNEKFKDLDEDAEEYDDYHTLQGLATAFTVSRFHNGDLANQKFIIKAKYNLHPDAALFDVNKPIFKKK